MWKIIVSMVMSAVGIIMIAASQNTNTSEYRSLDNTNYISIALGSVLQIAAFIVMLYGFRDFFIRDLLDELRSVKQRIPIQPAPPAPAPVDPKLQCFEPEPFAYANRATAPQISETK